MPRKIKWWLGTGYVGCDHDGVIEVDDDADDEDIDDLVRSEVYENISWGWEETKDDEDEKR